MIKKMPVDRSVCKFFFNCTQDFITKQLCKNQFNFKIHRFHSLVCDFKTTVGKNTHLLSAFKAGYRKNVLVPADKVANNVVVGYTTLT